ncbi:MAG: peptidylprolyl isomerase, partial [Cyanobacteria bacterium J06632_3]
MKLGFTSSGQRWSVLLVLTLFVATGCSAVEAPVANDAAPVPNTPVAVNEPSVEALTAGLPRLNGTATVEIKVGSEVVTVELDGDKAPITAGNFVDLAEKGVYDGTIFHRVVRSPEPFVAQGGDPQSADPNVPNNQLGTGSYVNPETGQPRLLPLEILPENADEPVYGKTLPQAQVQAAPVLNHRRGAIAMAR